MKRFFTFLLFPIALVLGAVPSVKADHMVGSDIYWKCDGGDSFTITIVDYRDCNGIAFVNSPFILTPIGGCPGVYMDTTVNGASSGGTDITPVCGRSCDRCTNPNCVFPYGIQQYFITATVKLPAGCCDYQISWEQCCRSAGITTGATWADYFITSQMSRCTFGYCDNSPYFSEPPVAIYCTNQCITYNPGANDDDRGPNGNPDSLSYAFTQPLTAANSPTPWTGNYSYTKPLDYDGFPNSGGVWNPPQYCEGFHLDSTTGDIEFKAVKPDVTVISIAVSEWRKDSTGTYQKIGEIRRDMQIIVINCPNDQPPIITGINGGTTFSEKICADQQTCFEVKAFDLDPPDTDYMSWNNPGTMDGASFTVIPNGQKWPTAVFCWFPTDKDVRTYPYSFIVTAVDNACPVPGRSSKAFSIYVIAAPSADYSATVEKCGLVYFQASPDAESSTTIVSYLWVGDGAPGHGPLYIPSRTGYYQYTSGGTYHYSLVVTGPNGCTRSYEDSVKIAPFPGIDLPRDTAVCGNSPTITVTAKPVNAFQPYQIWWNFKDANGDSLTTGSITEKITHDTAFRVNIFNQGCNNYDSMKVTVMALPQPNIGPDRRGCAGKGVMLSTGLKHEAIVNWTWINGKDTFPNQFKGDSILVNDSGTYVVSVQDSIGCPGTDTVNVYFNPVVQANRIDSTVCYGDSVTLRAGIGGPGASYIWIDQLHGRTVGTAPTFKFLATGLGGYGNAADLQVMIQQSGHGITCSDTGYYAITVNTPTHAILDSLKPKCIQDPAFPLGTSPPSVDASHQNGTWYYPRDPSAVEGNFLYPSIMGQTDDNHTLGHVHYLYTNAYGCRTDDSARIVISDQPQVSAGPDAEVCTANGRYLLSNSSVTPTGGLWSTLKAAPIAPAGVLTFSKNHDSTFFDPNASGVTDTVYGMVYTYIAPPVSGKSSCSNSDTMYVKVRTNPTVTVQAFDSLCLDAIYSLDNKPYSPLNGLWTFIPGDPTNPAALKYSNYSYTFYASMAGPGWHHLQYTAFGDPQKSLCPTTKYDSIYVVPAPANIDFHTSIPGWEFCESQGKITLLPTSNGKTLYGGEFQTAPYISNAGNNWTFDTKKADTTKGNPITYTLPYNKGACEVSVSHTIIVDGHPFVQINSSPSVCAGPTSFEINAARYNTTRLVWSSDGVVGQSFKPLDIDSTDVLYTPTQGQLTAGKFDISVEASNRGICAPFTAKIKVNINQPPTVDFASNQEGCEPLGVHFDPTIFVDGINAASNPGVVKAYDWDFGDSSAHSHVSSPNHIYTVTNGKDTQQYNVTITVTSDSGCVKALTKSGWITAFATPKPVISANPQFTTIALPQVQFSFDPKSSGIDFNDPGTMYRWTFGDSTHASSSLKNPQYSYGDTGTFKVRVNVTSKGCTGDTFITVYVQPELIIYIPNVFKPDGKHGQGIRSTGHDPNYFSTEVNNTFQPVISAYASFEMSIYNRWGQLMYTTADPEKGWDGTFEGGDALEGVYVYVIKASGYQGRPYTFTGSVTLVK